MGTTNHSTRKETPRISGQEKVPKQRESPVFDGAKITKARRPGLGELTFQRFLVKEFKTDPNNPTPPIFF